MRILFLSDTHLGIDLPSRPRVERPRRGEDFFRNYRRALAPALAGEVDVVVHGGDLLYRSRVPPRLAEAALAPLRALAAAGVPVLLVPGNHERGRITHPLLSLHPNLHVFDRPRTVAVASRGLRVAFAGFPYTREVRARFRNLLAAARRDEVAADVRVLCLHQCVEGATCGPGDFTFGDGEEVVRAAELPHDVAAVLCGHVHRHQILRPRGGPPVVYAGSVERTSFAEAGEEKGVVQMELSADGLAALEFHRLPARPMVVRSLRVRGLPAACLRVRLAEVLEATPPDAAVRLRLDGEPPPGSASLLGAAALRHLAGGRLVSLAWPQGRVAEGPSRGGGAPRPAGRAQGRPPGGW